MDKFILEYNGKKFNSPLAFYKANSDKIINSIMNKLSYSLCDANTVNLTVLIKDRDGEEFVDMFVTRFIMFQLRLKGFRTYMLHPFSDSICVSRETKFNVFDMLTDTGLFMYWILLVMLFTLTGIDILYGNKALLLVNVYVSCMIGLKYLFHYSNDIIEVDFDLQSIDNKTRLYN